MRVPEPKGAAQQTGTTSGPRPTCRTASSSRLIRSSAGAPPGHGGPSATLLRRGLTQSPSLHGDKGPALKTKKGAHSVWHHTPSPPDNHQPLSCPLPYRGRWGRLGFSQNFCIGGMPRLVQKPWQEAQQLPARDTGSAGAVQALQRGIAGLRAADVLSGIQGRV